MNKDNFNSWKDKLLSLDPNTQQSFILKEIDKISKTIPKSLLKNKKIITNE